MIFFLNFVFPGLFGHNWGPLKKKKKENIFFGRLGKSTSIRAIDLAVQHMVSLMMRVGCSIVLKKKTPLPASCCLFPNLSNGPFTNISDGIILNYSTVACYSPLWRSGDMLCCQMKNQRMSCLELLLSVLSASTAGYTKFLSHRWVNFWGNIHPCSEVFSCYVSKQRP